MINFMNSEIQYTYDIPDIENTKNKLIRLAGLLKIGLGGIEKLSRKLLLSWRKKERPQQ